MRLMVYHNTDRASPLDDFCRITPANGHVFKSHNHHQPLWERACSRRRRNGHPLYWLIHRFREQARSHREIYSLQRAAFG
ncbi:hypothetical protein DBR24_02245 [Pseudomonas sp. HMWF006]|nr:hypothetical protein DBR24_02245 [Pseudomonas sp. HMWF006]PTT59586.1 hypothetical protein DBR26_30965 [Pseudomonas sp. HMWF007]PTT92650.1 hypothetical protein DBR29_08790 [Pseudomonas sp. HMWF005]